MNRTSPMYSGMEVAVITSNGIKKTTIGGIETYDIQAGDSIVMSGQAAESVEE